MRRAPKYIAPRFELGRTFGGHPQQSWDRENFTDDASTNLASDYLRTFKRYRKLIAGLAALGLLLSFLLHLTTQPVYRTRTSLDIQTLNKDFVNMRSVDPTVAASAGETDIQTQIKLLESDSLREHVQDRLTMAPHPQFVQRGDLLSRLERLLHIPISGVIPFNDLLSETSAGVSVKPLGITRLLEIKCDSWNPTFAALFCNTLVGEFQARDLESRGSEAKRTSDWLMRQAADIRQREEDSQQRLFAATGGNGLILSQQVETVGEDRLRRMQAELVKAQADRMEKQAQAEVARSASADSTPSIADSPGYQASRLKLADLQGQVAALVPPLTEQNPKVIHLRSQIKQLQETMVTQRTDSSRRLENEYAAAKHREDLLAFAYKTEEGNVSSDLEKGSQVSLLRREVESEQQLYQTLLQRAKEAGFASAMQAATIRVVDTAERPLLAVYPQRITAALTGLLLGLLLGVGIAFFKDRNNSVFRAPGESLRLLEIDELGVIPSPPNSGWLQSPSEAAGEFHQALLPAPIDHPSVRTARWNDAYSLVAEAYRNATLSIMLADKGRHSHVYVVSSPSAGEGKTTVTSNLGIALSKSKLRVVLVDGDLRRPNLHTTLNVPNTPGLRDILRGDISMTRSSLRELCQPTAFPKLFVLPAGNGTEDPVELLHSPNLQAFLASLREDFDVVLIDSPPLLHMADARLIASSVEGAILILRSGKTTHGDAMTARDLLEHDRVRVMGTLLNDFNPLKNGQTDYYRSYYAYHQGIAKSDLAVR